MTRMSSPRALALRIGAVALLLIVALIGLLVREDRARAGGQEVRLAMEAVDPRSLLSGHYAALQLVERLEDGAPCPPDLEAHYGHNDSWVALSPTADNTHQVSGGGATRDAALRHGPVVVRGQADCRQAFLAPRGSRLRMVRRSKSARRKPSSPSTLASIASTPTRRRPKPWKPPCAARGTPPPRRPSPSSPSARTAGRASGASRWAGSAQT